jgi:hypothetical protein
MCAKWCRRKLRSCAHPLSLYVMDSAASGHSYLGVCLILWMMHRSLRRKQSLSSKLLLQLRVRYR